MFTGCFTDADQWIRALNLVFSLFLKRQSHDLFCSKYNIHSHFLCNTLEMALKVEPDRYHRSISAFHWYVGVCGPICTNDTHREMFLKIILLKKMLVLTYNLTSLLFQCNDVIKIIKFSVKGALCSFLCLYMQENVFLSLYCYFLINVNISFLHLNYVMPL